MWKFIKVFLAGIAVSFYFFPFEFTFLPGVNSSTSIGKYPGLMNIDPHMS